MSLHQHVDVVVSRHPDIDNLADEPGVSHHHALQIVGCTAAHQTVQAALVPPALDLREQGAHRFLDQAAVVRGAQRLGVPVAPGVDDLRIEVDGDLDEGLLERGVAVADDAGEQEHQEEQGEGDGAHAEQAEAAFRGITPFQ